MNTTSEMQLVQIDKLIPYINNARTHSPEQLNKLRSSLREFGFINPVIIDRDFNVIAGHGRILAAKAENISEVPCVFVDYLTPAQKKAYIIADNRMALDAGWDEEMLKVEIEALQADDFDLGLTGFDEKELAAFFDNDSDTKDDDFDVDAEMENLALQKRATSGCSEVTDLSAVTAQNQKLTSSLWTANRLILWLPTRRTMSTMRVRRVKSRTTILKMRNSISFCLTLSPAWRKLWRTMQASMFSTQIQRV